MKKLIMLISLLFVTNVFAADKAMDCWEKISKSAEFKQGMLTNGDAIFSSYSGKSIPDEDVKNRKDQIYTLLAKLTLMHCRPSIADIATKSTTGEVAFIHNNEVYEIVFKTDEMLKHINFKLGLLVVNKTNLQPGDILERKGVSFNVDEKCAKLGHMTMNVENDESVLNKAGKSTFGPNDNYFLSPVINPQVFPGIVFKIGDRGWGNKNINFAVAVVLFNDIKTGLEKLDTFANALYGTDCTGKNLAVYLVWMEDLKKDAIKQYNLKWWDFVTIGISPMIKIGTGFERLEKIDSVTILSYPKTL